MSSATNPPSGDQAKVSISLAVEPMQAFEAFTQDIDLWWRRGRRFRNAPGDRGVICLEPGVGGRVFESFGGDGGEVVVETGRIKVWDPPHRLLLEWRASNFAPAEQTEVEVLFEASASGTRVTLMHRGWSQLRFDHPVRHGQDTPAFIRMMGMWWADLLRSLSAHAETTRQHKP